MMPQMHDGTRQDEERLSPPAENKPRATPPQRRAGPTDTSPRRWISVLLSILGVALPLVAGTMLWWPWEGSYGFMSSDWTFYTIILTAGLTAVGGSILLRSPWSLLLVPVAWIVGAILGKVLVLLGGGSWPALQNEVLFWDVQSMFILAAVVPLLICAAIGAVGSIGFSRWLKRRHQRH